MLAPSYNDIKCRKHQRLSESCESTRYISDIERSKARMVDHLNIIGSKVDVILSEIIQLKAIIKALRTNMGGC
jgi:hypothetical protein